MTDTNDTILMLPAIRAYRAAEAQRERRKAATVGERRPDAPSTGERAQAAIEAGIWPVYTP